MFAIVFGEAGYDLVRDHSAGNTLSQPARPLLLADVLGEIMLELA